MFLGWLIHLKPPLHQTRCVHFTLISILQCDLNWLFSCKIGWFHIGMSPHLNCIWATLYPRFKLNNILVLVHHCSPSMLQIYFNPAEGDGQSAGEGGQTPQEAPFQWFTLRYSVCVCPSVCLWTLICLLCVGGQCGSSWNQPCSRAFVRVTAANL